MNYRPDEGIYYDIPFEDYLSWDAISNSRMNQARKSLRHFRVSDEQGETRSLRIGSLVHCGRLEPMALLERYAVMPAFEFDEENKTSDGKRSNSTATSYVKAKRAAFEVEAAGKTIVSADEFSITKKIVQSLHENAEAVRLLTGRYEVSIAWRHYSGLMLKARLDCVNEDSIGDLKTWLPRSGKSAVESFRASIASYGYHRQLAHYRSGWEALTGQRLKCGIVCVETKTPFCTMAAQVSEGALDVGREENEEALQQIANAYALNKWPGYESPSEWELPRWYFNQLVDDLEGFDD